MTALTGDDQSGGMDDDALRIHIDYRRADQFLGATKSWTVYSIPIRRAWRRASPDAGRRY